MRFLLTALAALTMASSAQAAVLSDIAGRVAINTGGGFQTVGGVVEVSAGTLVMAAPGGRARIVYGQSCEVVVRPGRVYTVSEDSTCAAAGSLKDGPIPASAGDAGYSSVGGITSTDVILGVFAGGLVAGAVAAAADGNSGPASP